MSHITAVILCGGAGERMQGAEKPLRPLRGRPLLERVLERLAPQADAVIVVANREPDAYAAFPIHLVDDGAYRGRGPLAGVAAGMSAASGDWVFCTPGDAPLLPLDIVQRLRQALQRHAADVAVVNDGSGRQPLCCLLPRRLVPDLRSYLDDGGTAPREWLKRFHVAEADCSDWPRWAWSLNTPEEWAAAEAQLSHWKDPP